MLLIDKKSTILGIYKTTQVLDIERIIDDIYTLIN
jgi:hypothetical protein